MRLKTNWKLGVKVPSELVRRDRGGGAAVNEVRPLPLRGLGSRGRLLLQAQRKAQSTCIAPGDGEQELPHNRDSANLASPHWGTRPTAPQLPRRVRRAGGRALPPPQRQLSCSILRRRQGRQFARPSLDATMHLSGRDNFK